jgi:hypothetical protein
MPNAGLTRRGDHRTFYKFGLVDPQNEPYARFRFYYRTWGISSSYATYVVFNSKKYTEEIDRLCLPMGHIDTNDSTSPFSKSPSDSNTRPLGIEAAAISADVEPDTDRYSISAENFGCDRNGFFEGDNGRSTGSGSPEPLFHRPSRYHGSRTSVKSSPDRGRSQKVTHIPVSAQHSMHQDIKVPATYSGSHALWIPPFPPMHTPLMPSSPPPAPPHGAGTLDRYLLPDMPKATLPDVGEPMSNVDVRRLSIPPSTVFRPFLEHGSLPLSPTKIAVGLEHASDLDLQPEVEQSRGRKRAETGGILRAVMANALKRRMTDSNVVMHQ